MSDFTDRAKEELHKREEKFQKNLDKGIKKTGKFMRRLLIVLVLALVAAVGVYMLYANYTFSEGTRSGVLVKISKKGMILKTYEGQLKMGGIDLQNDKETLSDTWSFSVQDEAVVKKLERLQGEKVILRYKEIKKAMPWQGDTNYFITDIEE